MRRIALVTLVLATGACGMISNGASYLTGSNQQTFEGQTYRARLSPDEAAAQRFVVAVGNLDRGLAGAKEAGRYEATKYCLKNFGWSGVTWSAGPDLPDASLPIVEGQLRLSGECKGWV